MKRIRAKIHHELHRHRGKVRPHNEHLLPAVLVLALLALAVAAVIARNVPITMQDVLAPLVVQPTPTPAPQIYGVGGTAESPGLYSLTVTSVRRDAVGSQPYLPGTGFEYYIVAIKIKNTGTAPLQIAPVVQTYLRDRSGTTYQMAPATIDQPFEAGALAPGEERSGELSYNVQRTAEDVKFIFDTGLEHVAPVTVQLQ